MFAAVVFCWMTGRAQDDRTTPAFGGGGAVGLYGELPGRHVAGIRIWVPSY